MLPRISKALLGLAVIAVAGLRPGSAAAQAAAEMKVTVAAPGQSQTLRGTGECGHEPRGWIYGKPAQLWLARFNQPKTSLSLSYWRPAATGAADMFSLSVQSGRKSRQISTIVGGKAQGSGRSTFQPTAMGGRFDITGTAADGAPVHVTIECARFGSIAAEGG